ncbi:glycoside hydrolase [Planobispora rosea]|uniref:Glycoside hydrolase n=1 Tax=Planobispora rosea TaxID=35762 RepID=A0A8J3WAI4_PLARO|nr:NlpC/P60 family protein [Planobispora rosea]GGS75312.1 glycoside hydrolase [Planobispora rosea]GIH81842.1 glycoside hydrolase [Planobispora rosea]
MHSVGSRYARAAMVAGLVCALTVGTAIPGGAVPGEPGPSADEVTRARAEARERDARLGTATARLAEAQAELEELTVHAEKLVEAYNGELVKAAHAGELSRLAGERALAAGRQVEEARKAVVATAVQSYGAMDPAMELITRLGSGMDPTRLRGAGILAHLSQGQAETLKRLRGAEEVAVIFQEQAQAAYAAQRAAAGRMAVAKAAAEQAVARQVAETRRLKAVQAVLEHQADAARGTAERLARERRAALERARLARLRETWGRRGSAWNPVAAGLVPRWAFSPETSSGPGDVAVDWALTQLGKPYVWAADGPDSYDCSGLTMRAWERAGVRLDHWTGTQWTSGPRVPLGRLSRGDLLFFGRITQNPGDIHHVGMYVGRGLMIHAPQTGDVVRIAPIWRGDLVGAIRPA